MFKTTSPLKTIKKQITPEQGLAWFLKRQERKKELQEKFQKDCDSGCIQELLKNAKPAF